MENSKQKITLYEYNELVDFTNYQELTPLQAIKLKCKECCCFNMSDVKRCEIKSCALNQFINRQRKYNITEADRERRREQLKRLR